MDWVTIGFSAGISFAIALVFYVMAMDRVATLRRATQLGFNKAGNEFFADKAKIAELQKRLDPVENALKEFMKDISPEEIQKP